MVIVIFCVKDIVDLGVCIGFKWGFCVKEYCVNWVNIWYCEEWKLFNEVN